MIYLHELTIPAQTSKASAVTAEVSVVEGVITEVNILFPLGCKGLVGVQVKDWQHIVWPTNPDLWLIADGETIHWSDDYELSGNPHTLTVRGYNEDDSYPHTIYFRFVVMEKERANLLQKLLALWQG